MAVAFATDVGVSAIPTPLYPLYEKRDGFGTSTVTIVFAAFSLTVAVSVVLLGPLSDRLGRRALLIPALLLDGISCLLFMAWPTLPGLILARALCGVSVGALAVTATAYLSDLSVQAGRRRRGPAAETLATAANLGGVGLGALLGGVLSQYAFEPLRLTYAVYLALLLITAALLFAAPEERRAGPTRDLGAQHDKRDLAAYVAALAGALLALSTLGLFASVVPVFLADTLHLRSHALAGATACLAFASAATAQILLGSMRRRQLLAFGYGLMLVGVGSLTLGLWISSVPLFALSGLSCGAGAGIVFKQCLSAAARSGSPGAQARSLTTVYLASYIGLAASIVGLGVLTKFVNDNVALLVFATVIALSIISLAIGQTRLTNPPGPCLLGSERE